jgi:non-ribosomal peptide synthase protein (TIGR01720 family)
VDRHLVPVPPGTAGELCVAGAGLARDYLSRPDLTAERFVPDPFAGEPGERMYRTGDLARHRPDGVPEFLGRVDDQVKIRGFRIEPGEIEAALLAQPEVREAAVLVREDVPGSKRLVAYLVPQEAGLDVADVRERLAGKLPEHMMPGAFVALDALPLTPSGKVDRAALPAPQRTAEEAGSFAAPRTEAEKILARLWEQILGVDRVGVDDNFLRLGGDSILSIQVVARASQEGLRLSPRQLFEQPTLAALAAVAGTAARSGAEQGPVRGEAPLTPIQAWFFEQEITDPHHWNQALLLAARERLDPAALARAVDRLIAHHDALRLRFPLREGVRGQLFAAPGETPGLARLDLSALEPRRRAQAIEAASAALQASLDLDRGPLARVALFDGGPDGDGRLLLLFHHLVVDGVSWRVLLADLQSAYEQASRSGKIELPPKTASFKQWAESMVHRVRSAGLRRELDDWLGQPWAEVSPLPVDLPGGEGLQGSARVVSVALEPGETRALLQEVPAAYRTRINDILLTALARAFAGRLGNGTLRIDLEGHGRDEVPGETDLSRTVGWFTAIYPVFLGPEALGAPGEALRAVKERLRAIPGDGSGFGLLRYLSDDPEVRRRLAELPAAEVLFNYLGQFDQVLPESSPLQLAPEPMGPACSPRGRRLHRLEVNGLISGGRLQVSWTYGDDVFRRETVEDLAARFLAELRGLIVHCLSPEAGGFSPSDFPLARFGQAQLDRLLGGDRRVEDLYPLSPTQRGLLFHSLYEPGSGAYVSQLACVLAGDLDVAALERAWQQTVDHHAALRTAFVWEDPEDLLQIVRRDVRLAIERDDWSGLPAEAREERLAALLESNRRRGLDISSAPLMRLALVRISPGAHQLVWCFHHLLLDGWSLSMVQEDVFALYAAAREGREHRLAFRPPYRDYIAWLQRQDVAATERFWRSTLAGFGGPGGRGERKALLAAERTAELEGFARRQELTLNTLVQGLWALLLDRFAGTGDVVFGVTVAGRPPELPGVESMVGLFINTLPLRVRVVAEAKATDWLAALQAHNVEMRQHEHTPLPAVARWSDLPPRSPLFESLLVYENYPVGAAMEQGPGRELAVRDVRADALTHYPLALRATPGPRLLLEILFDAGRVEDTTAGRLLASLETALDTVLAEPGLTVGELARRIGSADEERMAALRRELKGSNLKKLSALKKARPA